MTTYLGKSCSFCLPRVPFVNCCQFMYLVISLLVLRAGYGIWLYQFLIIAYLFTWNTIYDWWPESSEMYCIIWCSKEMRCYSKSTQKVILGSTFYINSDHILIINRVCADGIMLILYSKIDAMNQYSQPWLLYQPKCKGCPQNHF